MTPPTSSRRSERAAPVEVKKPEETVAADPPVPSGVEVISLDEAAEAEEAVVDDAAIADLGDDADDIPAAGDDDDTFLEEEEEGEADVTGIVGGGPKEET